MARTRRRKIGNTVFIEGPAWNPVVTVKDRFSRTYGTGCFDTPTINGSKRHRWRGVIENNKGVRERVALYGKTMAELKRKITAAQKPASNREAKKLTIETYLKVYFLPGIQSEVRANTYGSYERAVRLRIIPDLGKAKLAALEPKHVKAWVAEMTADKAIGPRAAQQAFMVLKRACNYAIDLEMCDRNPLQRLRAPKAPKKPQHVYGLEEVGKLLAAAEGSPWFPLFFTAIATSMRQGELFGLTWDSCSLDQGYLRVTKQLVNGHDGLELGEPKTATSKRRIDLSPEAVAVLKAHRKAQMSASKPNPHNLVFPNEVGGFVDRNDFTKRVFKPLLTKAELSDCTFHSLRNAGTSLLAQVGTSMKVLQSRLGHSTASMVMTYIWASASDGQAAAATLGALLAGRLGSGLKPKGGAMVEKVEKRKKPVAKGFSLVGRPGFEPGTSCLSSMRSTN